MTKSVVIFLFFSLLFTSAYGAKTIEVIAVEYYPFTTNTMPTGGIAFELLNELSVNEKYRWKPKFLPPKRAYYKVESGDWCASFYPPHGEKNHTIYSLGKDVVNIGLIRLAKTSPFDWSSLSEFNGKSLAMLRTGPDSDYLKLLQKSGVEIVFVETIERAIMMVLLNRVDMAMIDNISYTNITLEHKQKLQFSNTFLDSMNLRLFVNKECNLSLPSLQK